MTTKSIEELKKTTKMKNNWSIQLKAGEYN